MRILLDTCSLNPIPIKEEILKPLNALLKSKSAKLCILHVNFEERYTKKNILKNLRNITDHYPCNGLELHIKMSEIHIPNITKKGTAKTASDFQMQFYQELKKLVEECEPCKKEEHNLKRDAIIGVSCLDYDVFITSDKCLQVSLDYLIQKNIIHLKTLGDIPIIAYRYPKYDEILNEIKFQFEKIS